MSISIDIFYDMWYVYLSFMRIPAQNDHCLKGGKMQLSTTSRTSSGNVPPRATFEDLLRRVLDPSQPVDSCLLANGLNGLSHASELWTMVMVVSNGRAAFSARDEEDGFKAYAEKSLDRPLPKASDLTPLVAHVDQQGDDLLVVIRDPERTVPQELEVVHWSSEGVETSVFTADPFYEGGEIFSVEIPQGAVRPTFIVITYTS